MSGSDDEDDTPRLDPRALAALQEFYQERDTRDKQFEDLKAAAEDDFDQQPLSMSLFAESWQDSQFWYSDETAATLARNLLEGVTGQSRIAVVSAPSVYVQLRNLLRDTETYPERPQLRLFEFDDRFNVFKDDIVLYDFKQPLKLDASLKGSFDRIICDPPFLSDDCQSKARWLAKDWAPPSPSKGDGVRVILCTGERMETLAHKLYGKSGLRTTTFYPEHTKGLSNEFRCYANFESKDWTWSAEL